MKNTLRNMLMKRTNYARPLDHYTRQAPVTFSLLTHILLVAGYSVTRSKRDFLDKEL